MTMVTHDAEAKRQVVGVTLPPRCSSSATARGSSRPC